MCKCISTLLSVNMNQDNFLIKALGSLLGQIESVGIVDCYFV